MPTVLKMGTPLPYTPPPSTAVFCSPPFPFWSTPPVALGGLQNCSGLMEINFLFENSKFGFGCRDFFREGVTGTVGYSSEKGRH